VALYDIEGLAANGGNEAKTTPFLKFIQDLMFRHTVPSQDLNILIYTVCGSAAMKIFLTCFIGTHYCIAARFAELGIFQQFLAREREPTSRQHYCPFISYYLVPLSLFSTVMARAPSEKYRPAPENISSHQGLIPSCGNVLKISAFWFGTWSLNSSKWQDHFFILPF
jgi:hypothetical protein